MPKTEPASLVDIACEIVEIYQKGLATHGECECALVNEVLKHIGSQYLHSIYPFGPYDKTLVGLRVWVNACNKGEIESGKTL